MLANLDSVPWATLHHAYGPATDVPPLLRALASSDADARKKAWHELYGNLWHQGTVYEATAHAVPFLIELSQAHQVPDRHLVLEYLGSVALGRSYWDVHQHVGFLQGERSKPDFQERLDKELACVRATREAVRAGAPSYAALLADPAPLVRAGAVYLLGHFPEDAERNIGRIQAHIASGEANEVARTACLLAIGLLASAHEASAAWLEQVASAGTELRSVRVAAALWLAWSRGPAIPQAARALLVDAAASPGQVKAVFQQLPWEAEVQAYCSAALAIVAGDRAQSLPALIQALDDVTPYQSWDVARSMLHLVFADGPMPAGTTVAALTDDQRMALNAIVQSKTFWAGFGKGQYVANAMQVLQAFGLPDKPGNLQAFLGGKPAR